MAAELRGQYELIAPLLVGAIGTVDTRTRPSGGSQAGPIYVGGYDRLALLLKNSDTTGTGNLQLYGSFDPPPSPEEQPATPMGIVQPGGSGPVDWLIPATVRQDNNATETWQAATIPVAAAPGGNPFARFVQVWKVADTWLYIACVFTQSVAFAGAIDPVTGQVGVNATLYGVPV